jgi:hypothetical protein
MTYEMYNTLLYCKCRYCIIKSHTYKKLKIWYTSNSIVVAIFEGSHMHMDALNISVMMLSNPYLSE